MKLRHKLIAIFVTLSLMSTLIISIVGYNFISNESKKNINIYLNTKTDEMVNIFDKWLTNRSILIHNIEYFLSRNLDSNKITKEYLQVYRQFDDISDLYIGFENGSFISGSGWNPPKGYDPRKRPWYIQAKAANKLNFSDPYLDMTTKKYAISVGMPLLDKNGKLIGIIAEDLLLDTIIEQVKNLNLNGLGYGILIDKNGFALYHPNKTYINTYLNLNEDTKNIIQYMLKNKNGEMKYTLNHEDKIDNFRQLPSTGWILGAVVYKNIAYQSIYSLRNQYILIGIVSFILLILATVFFSKSITTPIRKLMEKTSEIAGGNFDEKVIISGKDEVAELAKSFNEMADKLYTSVEYLKESEEKYRDLVENSADFIYSYDNDGNFTAVNRRILDVLELEEKDLIGLNIKFIQTEYKFSDLFTAVNYKALSERQVIHEQFEDILVFGEIKSVYVTICPIYRDENKGKIIGYTSTIRDISEIKKYEKSVHRLAYYDALTDLPNRILLFEMINQMVLVSDLYNTKLLVMMINLDDFKKLNGTFSNLVGDEMIKEIAKKLSSSLDEGCVVSRVGGDEFIILIPNIRDDNLIKEKIKVVFDIFKEPFIVFNNEIFISISMGITVYPDNSTKISEIIQNVDTAMYKAKKYGKNTYKVFDERMKQELKERVDLENSIRKAIQNNEFKLFYQPIFHTRTGKLRGFEALIRWCDSSGNFVPPMEFITVAEETGQINLIGEWVLREACSKMKQWQDKYCDNILMSINISPIQFRDKAFEQLVCDIVEETGVKSEFVELEVTETVFIDSFEAPKKLLDGLINIGIKLSLDDFGTGYSSLSYLKNLSFHTLKIDRSFIADIEQGTYEKVIAGPLISLVHWLGLETIAEGVETKEQLEYLKEFDCDFIQGFLFSKALPENEIVRKFESGEFDL